MTKEDMTIDTPRKTYPPKTLKRTPVQAVQVHLLCESCGGEMRFTGMAYPVCPQQYDHVCAQCGKHDTAHEIYPTIKYEAIPEQP